MIPNMVIVAVAVALATLAPPCAATSAVTALSDGQDVNPTAAALAQFHERIDEYIELRQAVVSEVGGAKPTNDAAVIRGREQELAERIRSRRATAKHGDIFTAEVRPVFRRLLRPEFRGEAGQDIRHSLQDDAPAPDAVPLEVNAKYPSRLAFPTTPPPILQALPRLPPGLEYRIIGKDLILLDQPANLILDYIRNAIP